MKSSSKIILLLALCILINSVFPISKPVDYSGMVADEVDPELLKVDLGNPGEKFDYYKDVNHTHIGTSNAVRGILDDLVVKLHKEHEDLVIAVNTAKDVATKAREDERVKYSLKVEAVDNYNDAVIQYEEALKIMNEKIEVHKKAVDYRIRSVQHFHETVKAYNEFILHMAKEKQIIGGIHKLVCNLHGVRSKDVACANSN